VSSVLANVDFTLDADNPILIEMKQKLDALDNIVTWE